MARCRRREMPEKRMLPQKNTNRRQSKKKSPRSEISENRQKKNSSLSTPAQVLAGVFSELCVAVLVRNQRNSRTRFTKKNQQIQKIYRDKCVHVVCSRAFGLAQWVTSIWRHVVLGAVEKKHKTPQPCDRRILP